MGSQKQPSEAFYDIRRGRQRPWGPLIRRIDEAIDGNAPAERVRAIALVFLHYIDDRLLERDGSKRALR